MKKLSLLLAFLAVAFMCRPQISWRLYSQTFMDAETDGAPQLIAAIPRANNAFWSLNPGSRLKNSFQENKSFMAGRPENFVVVTTFDQEAAHFFVRGAGNGSHYEYRVLNGDGNVLVDWTMLTSPASDSVKETSAIRDLLYIGGYKAPIGHYLIVDLRRKNDPGILSTAVVAWRPIRPMLFNIYTVNELNSFLHRLSHPNGYYITNAERKKWLDSYGSENVDEVTGLPKKMVTDANDNSLIFALRANILEKEQVQYELVRDDKTVRPWGANEFDNNFIWLKDLAPGEYLLRIRYTAQPDNILEYRFKVKAPPGPGTTYLIGISSLIATFLALMIMLTLYLRQRRKAKKDALEKEKLEVEMKRLKSQLNPHFVFNSLNSIQGLINTGRIKESNEYIALFANLMRDTLNLSEINEAPLQREADYLDTYLRLEQLRFNFTYAIHIDPALPASDINFPTLLLQPLVENAVKHGIPETGGGQIDVRFSKKMNDLVITIKDNGKGFAAAKQKEGYGLHLTKQRIGLLNSAAGREQISMQLQSDQQKGTQVQLIFKEWL